MSDTKRIPFGLADITIGEGAEAVKFDGVNYLQAEGGEVTIEPILQEVQIADFGDSVYDDILNGFTGEITIVAGNKDLRLLKETMSFVDGITSTQGGLLVGLTDAKLGTSMRSRAKKVVIHPRIMGADKSLDIVIYKMGAVSAYNENYDNEQGKHSITLKMYPRDGFDPNKVGNFFYIGGTDPNQA